MSIGETEHMASGTRGFTLLEVMIALLIVGGVGLGMVAAVAADARSVLKAAAELEALAIAEEVIAQISTMTVEERATALNGTTNTLPSPWDHYSWRAQGAAVGGEPGLVDVAVVVTGPESEMVLKTRRYEPASVAAKP